MGGQCFRKRENRDAPDVRDRFCELSLESGVSYHYDRSMADTQRPKVVKFRPTSRSIQSSIRTLAKASENIIWTNHIRERMVERGIDASQVLQILRAGDVESDPVEGKREGEWKVKVTRKLSNGRVAGVVTIVVQDKRLRLLTTEWEDHR